jgi:RNA polymerase sigma factor (sigma-70 family)
MDTATEAADPEGRGAAAERLIEEYGALMLATARRWSASDQDAEDAFQHVAERVLRNPPTGRVGDICAWLRTAVKNQALSIVRHRRRIAASGVPEALEGPPLFAPPTAPGADVRVEQLERLRQSGQALRLLKPQEIRALQLRAEGYSYKEIAATTGWSTTKVNRCIAEGRLAFERALNGIESGAECRRLVPSLEALLDGGASAEEVVALRRHLSTCLACRARVRHHRAAA